MKAQAAQHAAELAADHSKAAEREARRMESEARQSEMQMRKQYDELALEHGAMRAAWERSRQLETSATEDIEHARASGRCTGHPARRSSTAG